MLDDVTIVTMAEQHWPAVAEIYADGIATGNATFDDEPPNWLQFDADKLPGHRHVAIGSAGDVLGWVAASPVSNRCVYTGVVEHSVYVRPTAVRRGIGRLLLDALIASTESAGIWTVQSGIFPENTASLALHRRAGFREVGLRHRLGQMTHGRYAGQWRDVVLLERRSPRVGTEPPSDRRACARAMSTPSSTVNDQRKAIAERGRHALMVQSREDGRVRSPLTVAAVQPACAAYDVAANAAKSTCTWPGWRTVRRVARAGSPRRGDRPHVPGLRGLR